MRLVGLSIASWNRISGWLRLVDALRSLPDDAISSSRWKLPARTSTR